MEAVTRLRAAVLTGMDHAHIVMPLATICGLDSLERVPCKSQSVILAQCEEARQPWLGSSLIGHCFCLRFVCFLFAFCLFFVLDADSQVSTADGDRFAVTKYDSSCHCLKMEGLHQETYGDPDQETDTQDSQQETIHGKLNLDSCTSSLSSESTVKEIKDFMRSNVNSKINVTELSNKINIPKSTLRNWLREIRDSVEKERRSAAGHSHPVNYPAFPPQPSAAFLQPAPASQVLAQARQLPRDGPLPQVSVLSAQHCRGLNA